MSVARKVAQQCPGFQEQLQSLAMKLLRDSPDKTLKQLSVRERGVVVTAAHLGGYELQSAAHEMGVSQARITQYVLRTVDEWLSGHGLYRAYWPGYGGGAERSFVRATAGKEGPQARDEIAWRVLEAGGSLTDASVSLSEAQPTLLG